MELGSSLQMGTVRLQLLPRKFDPVARDCSIGTKVSQHSSTVLTRPVVFQPVGCIFLPQSTEILNKFRLYCRTYVVEGAISTTYQQVLEWKVILFVFEVLLALACQSGDCCLEL